MNKTENNLTQILEQAITAHKQGRSTEAEVGYQAVLQSDSRHFEALHLLGILMLQRGEVQKGIELLEQAITADPQQAIAYVNLGNAYRTARNWSKALFNYDRALEIKSDLADVYCHRATVLRNLQKTKEALASYDRAIQLKPDYADAYCNRGVILRELNRPQDALISYDAAIEINPNFADVHNNRGNVLKQLGRMEEALASYSRAIELKPEFVDAYINRGVILRELNRLDAALADYDKAAELKSDHAAIYTARGALLKELKRVEESLASFDRAIALRPNSAVDYSNRGAVLREMKRLDEALVSYDKALSLNPQFADAYSNRGNALVELDRLEEALDDHNKAIELNQNNAGSYYNRGVTFYELGRLDEALADYAKALALKPDYAGVEWNESITRLLMGDFERGWQKYESRWQRSEAPKRQFAQPLWLGDKNLQGKTILLYGEQGFGDAIQFCRYVKMVAQQGARVLLEVREPLKQLLSYLEGVSQIIIRGEPLPPFDYQCPLLSLPLAFHTQLETIPAEIPYLFADPQKVHQWKIKLGEKTAPRVGLVWSGSPTHKNDRNRSLRIEQFLAILPPELTVFSLQKEVREQDQLTLNSRPDVFNFSEEIKDFSDTAALIMQMDLVISVDTSVAHLAGALGKPVWILLPHIPDWRWLLNRDDNPWYPKNVKLFRQIQRGDWQSVLSSIQHSVIHWLGEAQSQPSIAAPQIISFKALIAAYHQGQLEFVKQQADVLLQIQPQHFGAWHLLGIIALQENNYAKGIVLLKKTIEYNSNHAMAHFNLGHAYRLTRQWEEAVVHYNYALELKPNLIQAKAYRNTALHELLKKLQALIANPQQSTDLATAYYNRGFTLQALGYLEEALLSYQQAIQLKSDYLVAYNNCGTVLRKLKRLDEALALYKRVLAMQPEYASAHWNIATCQLLTGDFIQGWQEYEWRWRLNKLKQHQFIQPLWLGAETICDKTLLLYAEQGFGDAIQFCRYVCLAAQQGARVILVVPEVLKALMMTLEGVHRVCVLGEPLPVFDYHCPLLSLPLAFRTELDTIPAQSSYLFADEQKIQAWKFKLGEKKSLRVGLVWSGSLLHKDDDERSLSVAQLLAVLPEGIELFSVQKEIREEDQAVLQARSDLRHFGDELKDFSDTAALVMQMDLVISVDTAVTHLAGALGKPVWVLLPFVPDWRWLLGRKDSPWYPTARLFRQSQRNQWEDVLLELVETLRSSFRV